MELLDVLGPDGVLARTLEGFAERPQQLEMAEAVADALEQGEALIAEAGTGTGKTFAYLVPAMLSGQKVVISTGSPGRTTGRTCQSNPSRRSNPPKSAPTGTSGVDSPARNTS